MPILDVEIVLRPGESLRAGLAGELADRAGEVLRSEAGQTWVRLRSLPAERYAENGGGPGIEIHPVFVSVLKARIPPAPALRLEIAELTAAIAHTCDRPIENVHLLYPVEGAGHVAFGGRLVS